MAEYQGKQVKLDDPFRLPKGSKKKFGVYVKNDKGNVIMVKYGDPNLSIKRDDPERLKNFRARHNCDQKKDKTTPGYWSCKFWEKGKPVSKLLKQGKVSETYIESEAMYMNLTSQQKGRKQAKVSSEGVFGYKTAVEEAKRIKKLYPKSNVSIMQHARKGNFKFATDSIGIRRLEKQGYEVVEVIREGIVSEAEWSQKYKDSIDCDNPKGFSQKAHCEGKKKKAEEEQECNCGCDDCMNEDVNEVYKDSGLGDWFGKGGGGGKESGGWDRFNSAGERIGKCGDAKKGAAYSACLSAEKAKQLGKKGIADFVQRKRAAQKKAGDKAKGGESKKGQKPVMVKTGAKGLDKKNESLMSFGKFLREGENKPNNPALWKKAIAKAKAKFDVYPSAYANAWASKWYKGKGGTWSKK
tara:strand:+ start:6394 stop:7623 length:1230 start_codon:yes stop_codon:yes gene_type:complete